MHGEGVPVTRVGFSWTIERSSLCSIGPLWPSNQRVNCSGLTAEWINFPFWPGKVYAETLLGVEERVTWFGKPE
jgi:hypothetical protein